MAMFGRKQTFGQIPGMGMIKPEMQMPMGQQMQTGAMQPDMGAMTKKPNFFQKNGNTIIGVIGDTLATLGGGQGVYAPAMIAQKQQDAEIRARLQAALEKRKAAREDKQWEWENKPKEERAPYRWESNDGSLMEVGPDGQPRVVYKDPTAKVVFQPDGLGGGKWITQPTTQNLVPIGGTLPPKGGPVQQAPDTFPYR